MGAELSNGSRGGLGNATMTILLSESKSEVSCRIVTDGFGQDADGVVSLRTRH